MTSGQSSLFDRPIDLERLKYDPIYYQELKGTILLKLWLTAELRAALFKEIDMQVLYGRGSTLVEQFDDEFLYGDWGDVL